MEPDTWPKPHTRIAGDEGWSGWWKFPSALAVVTAILIAAAAIVAGPGQQGKDQTGPGQVSQAAPGAAGAGAQTENP